MTGVQLQLLTQLWKWHLKSRTFNKETNHRLQLGKLWVLSEPCPGSVTLGQSFTSPGIPFLSYHFSLVCWISRESSGFFFHLFLLSDASRNTKNIPTPSGSVSVLILCPHMKAELFSSWPECCHKQMHTWECEFSAQSTVCDTGGSRAKEQSGWILHKPKLGLYLN